MPGEAGNADRGTCRKRRHPGATVGRTSLMQMDDDTLGNALLPWTCECVSAQFRPPPFPENSENRQGLRVEFSKDSRQNVSVVHPARGHWGWAKKTAWSLRGGRREGRLRRPRLRNRIGCVRTVVRLNPLVDVKTPPSARTPGRRCERITHARSPAFSSRRKATLFLY
jgi:hypothetical protein